jgi:manganese/iron transport system permease protein/iron/zinc/copper transport system permease protein
VSDAIDWLREPFAFGFFRHGFAVAVVAGALCGAVGVYVVLRRMSYIGHGLSHAIFGGAAASALVSFNFYAGAGLWGLASALAIGRVARRRVVGADAAIGVITTASFALGIALLNRYGQVRRSLDAALFGSILGVSAGDVWVVVAVTALVAAVLFVAYRPLLFVTFDPEVAAASGVRVQRVDALLMLVLAVAILVTMKVLGAVLVAAALVTPATVARMLTDSFGRMLWLSAVIGAACGAVGMLWSYHADVASGAAIVLTGGALFGVVFAIGGWQGARRGRAPA